MRRRGISLVIGGLLVALAAWIAVSVAYRVPKIDIGMTEQQVEAILGKPEIRTQEEGRSGVAEYRGDPPWVLGRHDTYLVTYDDDARVKHFDLFENGYTGTRRTHR